jgi:hypothetical protein
MRLAVDIFVGLGVWFLVSFFAVAVWVLFVDLWRWRATKTTRPGAPPVRDTAHALGLVATPGREQPATTPPEAGPTRPGRATPKILGH